MAPTVDRLKELLFDDETRALGDIERRLAGVEQSDSELRQQVVAEAEVRQELRRRLDTVFDRAGTQERFEASVAATLDGALRKADVDRHAEVASAVAPFVVRTVKNEIRNSQDELVEALYPMTGRMVQAYVASALKDLANDINRRLEANPLMLRLRSLTTGKSMGELALADAQRLEVEELYLIRRGTGELIARWPENTVPGGGNRDHVMSGVLAAINEFSTEALKDEGSTLRQIDLGERHIYLRASPVYLLAAKCSGSAPQPVEAILDEAFLAAIERLHAEIDVPGKSTSARTEMLSGLSSDLSHKIGDKHDELADTGAGLSPLKLLAWMVGMPLLAWIGWSVYADYRIERARGVVAGTIAGQDSIKGYPVSYDVRNLGRHVTLSGLMPSEEARAELVERLAARLPGAELDNGLTVLPSGLAEVEPRIASVRRQVSGLEPEVARVKESVGGLQPEIAEVRETVASLRAEMVRSSVVRSLERTAVRLRQIRGDLGQLASSVSSADEQGIVAEARKSTELEQADVDKLRAALTGADAGSALKAALPALQDLARRVTGTGLAVARLIGPQAEPQGGAASVPPADAMAGGELLAAETERVGSTVISAGQILAFRKGLPAPQPAQPEPTPRQRLEAWARANAIFFTADTTYRDEARTEAALDELARLMRDSGQFVRVVGYTDNKGDATKNETLGQLRAEKIAAELAARGVKPDQLVVLGRKDSVYISHVSGETSPNRRVEFEVGFEGEGAE